MGFPTISSGPLKPKALCVAAVEGTQRCHHLVLNALSPTGSREEQKHTEKAEGSQERGMPRSGLREEQARLTGQGGGELYPSSELPATWMGHDGAENCFY